ncbi:MAG: glycerophosphodiester phosphodiesterase [Rhizobium sp.]|nr:glycerophosphodiester phosphodiesterase [Rhizobium sp.]
MHADIEALIRAPIAHRGLHDGNKAVWENTLSAFEAAIARGFAIECDLQYAADAVPVIFHDDDMERLCRIKGDVRARSSGELGLMSIGETADKVPSLARMLSLVRGRVPIVLELKGRHGDDEGFASSVLELVEEYEGPIALMSFDQWLLSDIREHGTTRPLGLTAEGTRPGDFALHEKAMAIGIDFISYNIMHLPNDYITLQRSKGVPVISWTVRNPDQQTHSAAHAEQITFEGFDPT